MYPEVGLNLLARRMAAQCSAAYDRKVVKLDVGARKVALPTAANSHTTAGVDAAIEPAMQMAGMTTPERPDPHTSVLVVSIGAVRGDRSPDDHWLYIPGSDSGFHRVGFYSNVDRSFLPASARDSGDKVSIYVNAPSPAARNPVTTK